MVCFLEKNWSVFLQKIFLRFDKNTLWSDQKKCYMSMTWPFEDIFHGTKIVKYKLILSMKTIGSCGPTCVVWLKSCVLLKRKLALFVGNACIMCRLWKFLEFSTPVIFPNFLSNWVNLLGIFASCEKLRAFERNQSFWNNFLMPWRPII